MKNGDPKRAEISVKEKLKVYMEKNNVAAIAPAKAMLQAENKVNDKSASSSSANQDPKLGNPSHQKDQSCNICYNEVSGVKYFHHQFSTQTVREGNKTSSLCTICRQVHSMERPLRRRILITCSTLYRCWEHTEFKPSCCFDVEAIVGGTFEDGERALRRNYFDNPEPCDVMVVMGINNISKGQDVEDIFQEILQFEETLKKHYLKHFHASPNCISFATCIQPPKYATFNAGAPPTHIAKNGNHFDRIQNLNEKIRSFNENNGLHGIAMHMHGVRFTKTAKYHKDKWREDQEDRKLHFKLCKKAKIGNLVAKFFTDLV